eukprot:gene16626-22718_t
MNQSIVNFVGNRTISLSSLFTAAGCLGLLTTWIIRQRNMRKNLKKYLNYVEFEIHPSVIKDVKPARVILVTGGNGFVGSHIIDILLSKEETLQVIVLDVVLPAKDKRNNRVTYVKCSILDVGNLSKIFEAYKIDSIIHTASLIPYLGVPDEAIMKVNVQGSQNLINCALKFSVKSFVYTSSCTVIMSPNVYRYENISEDIGMPKQHIDTYTASKGIVEKMVSDVSNLQGMVTCSLRPGAVFGKGDKLISDNCKRGVDAFVIGDGTALQDYVLVENVALAHVLAEKALATKEGRLKLHCNSYFIGSNESTQYGWFNGLNSPGSNPKVCHWEQPYPTLIPLPFINTLAYINLLIYNLTGYVALAPSLAPSLLQFTQKTYTFNSNKAKEHFGYVPILSVKDSILKIVQDYQANISNNK